MSDNLKKLEREVEIARSRLRSDLSVLSSPHTYATAIQAKLDELIRSSAASNKLIRAERLTESEVEELRRAGNERGCPPESLALLSLLAFWDGFHFAFLVGHRIDF